MALVSGEAVAEVVALEHARDRRLRHELDDVGRGELVEPLGVVRHLGDARVEHLEGLGRYVAGAFHHLLARQARAQIACTRRVPDHRREVADKQDDGVAEVLELAHLR